MEELNERTKIVVIGASAGGLDAIKLLVSKLPVDFSYPVFIVWHISPDSRGALAHIINQLNTLPAAYAEDNEKIQPGRIYIASPDKHLLLEKDIIRITHGPKENRFRPAIDPLFRSAAFAYGSRVIGIVLSGALDDGTAGLWSIKRRGGITIVQEPSDAVVASMPASALQAVEVDFHVPAAEIGDLLVGIWSGEIRRKEWDAPVELSPRETKDTQLEIKFALMGHVPSESSFTLGEISPYSCPECHGVLTTIKEGERIRFRCHTGHAFSADSLLYNLTETIEKRVSK